MNAEREKAILQILIREKQARVTDLAKRLYASEPSIRRDLNELERQHLLRRIHGGAILDETGISEIKIPFLIRELESSDEKIQIARRAAQLVPDESVIFLDASTSAYQMIPFLSSKKNLTVITNGIHALKRLSESGIKTIGTGGEVIHSCLALVGDNAHSIIDRYNADLAFFSCRGLSDDGYLTDISEKENHVRHHMIAHARWAYLLCTPDKIGHRFFHTLCQADEISGIVYADSLIRTDGHKNKWDL
ncbi:MAG: DeoR/GlpR transcriptional regulator [Lachnospiraceae bacterium]|nr:DeoR/GlpR transcriptional regulator [Lachnospiraceae bacterium]